MKEAKKLGKKIKRQKSSREGVCKLMVDSQNEGMAMSRHSVSDGPDRG